MKLVASRPSEHGVLLLQIIVSADLVFGVWNQPGEKGLFSMVIKGDGYVDRKTAGTMPPARWAAIPCRNMKEAIGYRALFGADSCRPDGKAWKLHRGPEIRADHKSEVMWPSPAGSANHHH
ncbi:MAG: hypothetical protein GY873_13720 [Bosea sp.]|uniref:hypothetical protein n=1 Tax=Bosea sp. (in: a-proteobacteria) TaxID=1871050 RepID=UPI0023895D23|nr:hypothetical protein [Bosea sp. (in: a-proteobacteria)]MCP4735238.1 hypothetical protein [Bosea sp. (in: a-proteobacteria)]